MTQNFLFDIFFQKISTYAKMKYFCSKVIKKKEAPSIKLWERITLKIKKNTVESGPGRFLFRLAMALLLVSGALFLRNHFASEGETPKLSPKEEIRLAKKLREIDDAEQYALVAKYDGFYPCMHSGFQMYYLKSGEVWKYDVTTKGEKGRYAPNFLLKNNVIYEVQFKGNIAECLKQEQIQLFIYPFLLENLARPSEMRLPRPPYNPIMR